MLKFTVALLLVMFINCFSNWECLAIESTIEPGLYRFKQAARVSCAVLPIQIAKDKKGKTPFAVQHPKLWLAYRAGRKFVVKVVFPLTAIAGSASQVVTALRPL